MKSIDQMIMEYRRLSNEVAMMEQGILQRDLHRQRYESRCDTYDPAKEQEISRKIVALNTVLRERGLIPDNAKKYG